MLAMAAALATFAIRDLARRSAQVVARQPWLLIPAAALTVAGLAIGFTQITHQPADTVLFSGQLSSLTRVCRSATLSGSMSEAGCEIGQVAARRDRVHDPGHDPVRVVLVADRVQGQQADRRDWPGEVQRACGLLQDLRDIARIGVDVVGGAVRAAGQQRAGMSQHDRVVVHVDDPAVRRHLLRDLVGVARGRDAGAVWAAYLSIMRDSELVETELSPRERELVTWSPRGGRTLRSRSSCSSASAPCAHTWTGSGTKLACRRRADLTRLALQKGLV